MNPNALVLLVFIALRAWRGTGLNRHGLKAGEAFLATGRLWDEPARISNRQAGSNPMNFFGNEGNEQKELLEHSSNTRVFKHQTSAQATNSLTPQPRAANKRPTNR